VTGPCTPATDVKDAILKLISLAREVDAERKDHARQRFDAMLNSNFVEADIQNKMALADDSRVNALLTQALSMTAAAYHVGPTAASGTVVAPKDPLGLGGWSAGIHSDWNPQVLFDDNDSHQMFSTKNEVHYGGGRLNPEQIAGVTYADGTVKILAQNLFDAQQRGNPGEIAAILDHEAQHFNDLMTRGFSSKEECEMRAYAAEGRDAGAFELTPSQVGTILDREAAYEAAFKAGLKNGHLTSYFPAYNEELSLADQFITAQKKLRDFDVISREITRNAADQRLSQSGGPAAVTAAAVKQCGFEPHFVPHSASGPDAANLYFFGYATPSNADAYYQFPSAKSMDALRVSLMLARTCSDMRWGRSFRLPERVDSPCNDGLAILNDHADDPAFFDSVGAAVSSIDSLSGMVPSHTTDYRDECVTDKLRSLRFPADEAQYRRLFEPMAQQNIKKNRERDEADRRWNEDQSRDHIGDGGRPTPPPRRRQQPLNCHWVTDSVSRHQVLWCD
jgi:hypothetical protein